VRALLLLLPALLPPPPLPLPLLMLMLMLMLMLVVVLLLLLHALTTLQALNTLLSLARCPQRRASRCSGRSTARSWCAAPRAAALQRLPAQCHKTPARRTRHCPLPAAWR
jgi:hypothetical protein